MFDFTVHFEDAYIFLPYDIVAEFKVHCTGTNEDWWPEYIEAPGKDRKWGKVHHTDPVAVAMMEHATHYCTGGRQQVDNAWLQARQEYRDDLAESRAEAMAEY